MKFLSSDGYLMTKTDEGDVVPDDYGELLEGSITTEGGE